MKRNKKIYNFSRKSLAKDLEYHIQDMWEFYYSLEEFILNLEAISDSIEKDENRKNIQRELLNFYEKFSFSNRFLNNDSFTEKFIDKLTVIKKQ